MPAPDILQQITDDFADSLRRVDVANDYPCTLTVEMRKVRGNAPRAGQKLAVIDVFGDASPLDDGSQDQSTFDQAFGAQIFADPSEDLDTPIDQRLNELRAAGIRAICGTDRLRERNGLAFNTQYAGSVRIAHSGVPGIQLRFIVRYSTAFNDPLTFAAGS